VPLTNASRRALNKRRRALNNVTMRRRVVTGSVLQGMALTADTVANAIKVAKILTGEILEDMGDSGKDKAAQALGRKGGAARREKLTPERRAEIARKAAAKRWSR
jgi:hypothetical protein